MIILFWLMAFIVGAGVSYGLKNLNVSFLTPSPSSPTFMLIALLIVTVVYQIRMNMTLPKSDRSRFIFAPPDATILGDVLAFFAGVLTIQNMYAQ